jgi:hypothetical protein
MANTVSIVNNNAACQFAPTGKKIIVNGVSNPIKIAAQANQQVLVGDLLIQNNSSNVFTALPAVCATCAGDTNNLVSNNTLQAYIANNFAGFSASYRSPKNTSSGKPADVVGVATGRVRVPVSPNSTAAAYATGVGQLWAVRCTQTNAYNGTANVANNAWVETGADGLPTYDLAANNPLAIGRQALPKAANEPFVWIDTVSRLLAGALIT